MYNLSLKFTEGNHNKFRNNYKMIDYVEPESCPEELVDSIIKQQLKNSLDDETGTIYRILLEVIWRGVLEKDILYFQGPTFLRHARILNLDAEFLLTKLQKYMDVSITPLSKIIDKPLFVSKMQPGGRKYLKAEITSYRNEKNTIPEIAKKMSVSQYTVKRLLTSLNVPKTKKNKYQQLAISRKYYQKNIPISELAEQYNCSVAAIKKFNATYLKIHPEYVGSKSCTERLAVKNVSANKNSIIKDYIDGTIKVKDICAKYGVHRTTVNKLVREYQKEQNEKLTSPQSSQ